MRPLPHRQTSSHDSSSVNRAVITRCLMRRHIYDHTLTKDALQRNINVPAMLKPCVELHAICTNVREMLFERDSICSRIENNNKLFEWMVHLALCFFHLGLHMAQMRQFWSYLRAIWNCSQQMVFFLESSFRIKFTTMR
jgi:hypothetical protein